MLLGFAFRASVKCPECQTGLAIQRVVATETCEGCAARVPLTEAFQESICDASHLDWVMFSGEPDNDQHTIKRTCQMPACESCARVIDPTELEAALATGSVACACGTPTRVRAGDPILTSAMSALRYLVGESMPHDDAPKVIGKPMVMPCAQCQAPLSLDGSSRTVVCRYCDVSNILPEGLWRQLHPARQRRQLFLVFDLAEDEVARRTYGGDWFKDPYGAEPAGDPSTPVAALRGHAAYGDSGTRAAVAANRSAPPDLLTTLATDPELEVRLAVAANPRTPADVLAKLLEEYKIAAVAAKDPNLPTAARRQLIVDAAEEIRSAALSRADVALKAEIGGAATSSAVLKELATDSDPSVLRAVASNTATPPETLAVLAKVEDRSVVEAARKNPSYKKRWWQL